MQGASSSTRIWLVALLAVAAWLTSAALNEPHRKLPLAADPSQFSADRAELLLTRLLGSERPHPVSSAENAAVRTRILQEFGRLGIAAQSRSAFACDERRQFALIACATVTDLIAQVLPGDGKAVLMVAHYDSVPSGPGASDNMSGVASILEAARALRAAAPAALHPVMALITDGEEAGLIGAHAFLQDPSLKAQVGAVVNVDARGTRGPSLLFQSSRGDGPLIDLYARHVPAPDTSSLFEEIYRRLPNDTDLTPFLEAGFPSLNFAFIGNVRYYHSPLDLRRNLSVQSLQMHGDNLLGVVRTLAQTPYAGLMGDDAIYLSLFNRVVPRMPASWALPVSIAVWLAIAAAAWLRRAALAAGTLLRSLLAPPALLLGCLGVGFVLSGMARIVSGMPDPSYAHPLALRVALALGSWAVALAVARWTDAEHATVSVWLSMATLSVLAAALAPGLAPYFLFPSLIAAPLLLASARIAGGWDGQWGRLVVLIAALGALAVWTAFMALGETLMGLRLHALFTLPAAFALMSLLPLLNGRALDRRVWRATVAGSAAAALVAALIAGLLPTYSIAAPQRLNLIYLQDRSGAHWLAEPSALQAPSAPLPRSLQTAAAFRPERIEHRVLAEERAYVAPADDAQLPLPIALVATSAAAPDQPAGARTALIELHGSSAADAMILYFPAAVGLRSIELRGQRLLAPPQWRRDTWLACLSRDCRDESVRLEWSGGGSQIEFAEQRYGLPPFGAPLLRARPRTSMSSQSGDQVMLVSELSLPEATNASPPR